MNASHIIVRLIDIYMLILIVRIIMSWIPHDRSHPIVQLIYRATDPVLLPARRIIPPIGGTLDISPILVFFALEFLKRFFMGGRM